MKTMIVGVAFFLCLGGVALAQQTPCNQSLRAVTAYANTATTERTQLSMQVAELGVLVADLRKRITTLTQENAALKDVPAAEEGDDAGSD